MADLAKVRLHEQLCGNRTRLVKYLIDQRRAQCPDLTQFLVYSGIVNSSDLETTAAQEVMERAHSTIVRWQELEGGSREWTLKNIQELMHALGYLTATLTLPGVNGETVTFPLL